MVTLYLPGTTPGNEYAPFSFVTTGVAFSPVARFTSSTVAPGTRPSLSFTVPLIVVVLEPPCANTGVATKAATRARTAINPSRLAIHNLLGSELRLAAYVTTVRRPILRRQYFHPFDL